MGNPWMNPELARRWMLRMGIGGPYRDEQIGVLAVLAEALAPRRVLELGVGAGFVAARVLARLPGAEYVGMDASAGMLEGTEVTLEKHLDCVTLVETAFEDDWTAAVGDGFDVVLTAQTVHHVEGEGKRAVFSDVLSVLKPGGTFLFGDRFDFDPALFALHKRLWDRMRDAHDFERLSEAFTYDVYRERLGDNEDVPDTLERQMDWLREVGFTPVEPMWKHGDRAVIAAIRPG